MYGHILHDAPKKLDIINVSLRQRLVNTDGVETPILEMGGSHTFLHPLKSFIAAANTVRLFLSSRNTSTDENTGTSLHQPSVWSVDGCCTSKSSAGYVFVFYAVSTSPSSRR